jgi:hypothetical protein
MNRTDALIAVRDLLPPELQSVADPIAELTVLAYDKGWEEATRFWISEMREKNETRQLQRTRNPTADT